MTHWFEICRAEEVPSGRGLARFIAGEPLAVVNDAGKIHVFQGVCPHAGGPMGRGWIEDGRLLCPLHRWAFRLEDGACTTFPEASIHKFRSEIRDGVVFAELLPTDSHADGRSNHD